MPLPEQIGINVPVFGSFLTKTQADLLYSNLGHNHDLIYAALANGVTGGNAHTHLTGDGAIINRGFHIDRCLTAFSPADAEVRFFANGISSTSESLNLRLYVPVAGKITSAYFILIGTPGTSESISVYLRKSLTTDYLIDSKGFTVSGTSFVNNAMNIDLAVGNVLMFKVVFPTFATNPTNLTCLFCFGMTD